MRSSSLAVLASALLALAACGGGGGDSDPAPSPTPAPQSPAPPSPAPATPTPSGPTITIQGMTFIPLVLEVRPGAVVTVRNLDSMAHSVTSQSVRAAYTPGAAGGVAFETGAFTGTTTFTIPANATVGTTVPYYCSTHLATMATPNGEIRIVAAPASTPPPADPVDPNFPY